MFVSCVRNSCLAPRHGIKGCFPVHAARLAYYEGQEVKPIQCPDSLSDSIHPNFASQMKEKRGGKGTQSERVLCKFLRQGAGGLGGGGDKLH